MKYRWHKVKHYLFPALSFGLNLLVALFWVALRINHSGISKFLGADTNPSFLIMNLPVMVCVAAWIGCAISLVGLIRWDRHKWPGILGFVLGLVFCAAGVAVVIFGAKDYLRFILPHFWTSVAVSGGIIAFALLLFFPIRGRNGLKTAMVALVILAAVVIGYQLRPCTFTYGAVVYAVEDEYQIVFSTSDSAIAWVEIDGKCYYDLYAGSMRSADRVHKITVPQSVLDEAGGYTVCAKQMIYRGPFGGYTGPTISRGYDFRAVDPSDGLNYVSLSDVHEAVDAAVTAASGDYAKNLDFVVLLGDLVSMVETEKDAQLANELAHGITGGEIPVIYARGNHEIKGEYGEVLYKYVGSKNQSYTYWVTLSDTVFAVVLDMGEDHEDDWWEYYGTAQFDLYRQEQTQMLREILSDGDYRNYPYRMALCHVPIVFVDGDNLFGGFRKEWTTLLNQMDVDISLSGHEHRVYTFLPGAVKPGENLIYSEAYNGKSGVSVNAYMTDHEFPTFLVGRRSLEQAGGTQKDGNDQYLCLVTRVDLTAQEQTCVFVNSRQEMVTCVWPFEGNYPGETFRELVLPLNPEK